MGEEEMKVLVGVKLVVDANVKVRVRADGSGVETAGLKQSINPFCEIAVEEGTMAKCGRWGWSAARPADRKAL
jgi:electron transfer flavoprotein alpha/beta subunit